MKEQTSEYDGQNRSRCEYKKGGKGGNEERGTVEYLGPTSPGRVRFRRLRATAGYENRNTGAEERQGDAKISGEAEEPGYGNGGKQDSVCRRIFGSDDTRPEHGEHQDGGDGE
jgi:hypothetical protein